MTAKPKDLTAVLEAMEDVVERQLTAPDALLSELATLLLGFPRDSVQRPRVHRMLGVVYGRLDREADAIKELREARALAASLSPPNYGELGNIARALSALYAARGEDRLAAGELIAALTFTSIGGCRDDVVKLIADVGHGELDARRFENGALLFDFLLTGNDTLKVPEHAAQSARIGLIQALNALGRHDEIGHHVKETHATLKEEHRRLRFLTQLEAARAAAGLGRHDEAEGALLVAENFLPEDGTAPEHAAFVEAVTELQEVRAGESAIESLEHLIEQYTEQKQPERIVVACRALASAQRKRGAAAKSLEALGRALQAAMRAKLGVAGELRTELLRRAGSERLVDLAGTKSLIGQNEERDRRFVKLSPLGRGSAGESALAVDVASGDLVSLRTLDLGGLPPGHREAALSKQRRAYTTAATLSDPRLAKVRDMRLAEDGMLHSVQSRPAGPTLRDLHAAGADPLRMLDLLASTAGALGVLHGRELAHRDLSPEHVVVARDDQGRERPVLADLGLAPVAGVNGFSGTPPYVAPEQVANEASDTRADIHALGQMIAEIWGGRVPTRANLGRLWKRDAEDGMPRAIGELVRSMVAADPERRLTDLNEVAQVLRAQRENAD
ncbi:hypothetical protein [Methyloceanibacter sp.]|uniref:protein kinase domain-containing protein n=1 Tax=Methyloceanibacter sp. TaxID=1965321 RepID=UPI002C5B96EE|nr:hypothetical protein [Methyloceanibacter sp.]HML91646.1 hypothetical protein [Methyloceanibacter sp.]